MTTIYTNVGLVGTGAMGRGIAQIAAQAGSTVLLHDAAEGAAERAREQIIEQWKRQQAKGKLATEQVQALAARLQISNGLADLAVCDLVVEAIV